MNSPSTTTSTTSSPYTPLLSFAKRTAQDPLYAYGLSALFWASVPVSFLSAHSDARSSSSPPRLPSSASSSSAASKTPLAKALDAHSFDTVKSQGAKAVSTTPLRGGLAPFWQLAGIGSLIGLGGYITSQGDSLNGAGTVTAWSLLYLAFHGYPTLRAGKPWPIALTLSTAVVGASIHGVYYFDRTSWRGAIPGISQVPQQQQQQQRPTFSSTTQQSSAAIPALMLLSVALGGRRAAVTAAARSSSSATTAAFMRHSSSSASSKATRFVHPIDPSTIPRGFAAAYGYAGIKAAISPKPVPDASAPTTTTTSAAKPTPKPDLALIVSTTPHPAACAGTFTRNVFKAAPVVLSSQIVSEVGKARSVLINSGCANAVTGQKGLDDAKRCDQLVGELLGTNKEDKTVLLSTGVIGVPLPMKAIEDKLPDLAKQLDGADKLEGEQLAKTWHETSRAFMTTDTFPKLRTRTFELDGQEYRMLGIDKGAGMIHPNMAGPSSSSSSGALHATLLGFIATDAPIAPEALQEALEYAVSRSFNCISVDGDMSTNDTILALANNHASLPPNQLLTTTHPSFPAFRDALTSFSVELAQLVVRDGEGAEKFVEVNVTGAPDWETAHAIAGSISTSALVKCALHGGDANWGRILCAVGYAKLPSGGQEGWSIDPMKVSVRFLPPPSAKEGDFEPLTVLKDGAPQPVDEEEAGRLLALEDIVIEVDLQGGAWADRKSGGKKAEGSASYWTCDFSKEYVAINGDYRS